MKNALILGAGLVARPIVRYLLDQPDIRVTCASRTVRKAVDLIAGHPRGEAQELNAKDSGALEAAVAKADIAISLLPATDHPPVARLCVKHRKSLVTTSYVSPEMRALDAEAKKAGVLLLNELGLDPGIDHMSAMRVIDGVRQRGGTLVTFRSYCGGLPAPEANTNPFGYKFSWSPRGVVLAAMKPAIFLKDGREVNIDGDKLFRNFEIVEIPGAGKFEGYPNRNSLDYIPLYDIGTVRNMFRGTLRNLGHCDRWWNLIQLGLLRNEKAQDLKGKTYAGFLRGIMGAGPQDDLAAKVGTKLGLAKGSPFLDDLRWLGFLAEEQIPLASGTELDVLVQRLLEKLQFAEGERDMVVLHHEFHATFPGGKAERTTSSLVACGEPRGDTAMAQTVSLPPAIAVKMILEGKIKETGVHIPVQPQIYTPILGALEKLGIRCLEHTGPLS